MEKLTIEKFREFCKRTQEIYELIKSGDEIYAGIAKVSANNAFFSYFIWIIPQNLVYLQPI